MRPAQWKDHISVAICNWQPAPEGPAERYKCDAFLIHAVRNLTNIPTSLSAAKGGIEDADFANKTTDLAKNQILQQVFTAMVAQANAAKQNVLSLLQG